MLSKRDRYWRRAALTPLIGTTFLGTLLIAQTIPGGCGGLTDEDVAELVKETIVSNKDELVGPQGPQGPQGIQGNPGEQGVAEQGAPGPAGQKGDTGPQGAVGPQGPKGDKPNHEWIGTQLRFETPLGAWGTLVDLKGPKGDPGDPGGPVGPMPAHEWQGASLRFQNPNLSWGSLTNLQGPAGPVGPAGAQGAVGAAGPQGAQGQAGPIPAHEWQGTNLRFQNPNLTWGTSVNLVGPTGPAGSTGPQGPTGPAGPQGPQGPPGTSQWTSDSGGIHYSSGAVGIGADAGSSKALLVSTSSRRYGIDLSNLSASTSRTFGVNISVGNSSSGGATGLYVDSSGDTDIETAGDVYVGGRLEVNNYLNVYGMTSGGGTTVVVDSGGRLYKQSSSLRYKEEVRPLGPDRDEVLRLRPVRFTWRSTCEEDVGLIAEEVAATLPDLVIRDAEGRPEAVKYDRVSVYLLEVVRSQRDQLGEQQKRLDTIEARLAELEAMMAAQLR